MDRRAGGAQQPGQGQHDQQHRAAQRRAQAARGIGIEGELPPQLMAIGHVLVGEQQKPDRRTDHAGAGYQVDRREGQFQQSARTVERAPEQGQQARGEDHDTGFFPVEALEQGQQGADQEQYGGQHPRCREATAQALGQQQAEHADQAGAEVRGIDQAVRDQEAQVLETGIDFRGGTREQQHHAGKEYQHGEHWRSQARGDLDRLLRKEEAARFAGQQDHAGHQHRQHHVDEAIQQQRGGQRRSAQLVGKGGQQDRFEYTDAARYMAEDACRQGQEVDQQEGAESRASLAPGKRRVRRPTRASRAWANGCSGKRRRYRP
ncbi:hypothetical protein COLO4_02429 [Corchorus olitorius]|uniref:Uncharacterized protein n=1 Tax=Corchorus olitorius TaxID=93759 RepID=A0A1R3L0Z2_9ROSI|nr:hypothetical protein COLO4_02429 [Corchorus olitorius]